MSSSQNNDNKLDKFISAKSQFLKDAAKVRVANGIITGIEGVGGTTESLDNLDSQLLDLLEMGVQSGLTPESPQMLDMEPISHLIVQAVVTEAEWFSALRINLGPNSSLGGSTMRSNTNAPTSQAMSVTSPIHRPSVSETHNVPLVTDAMVVVEGEAGTTLMVVGEGEAGTIPMDRTEGEAGTTPMVVEGEAGIIPMDRREGEAGTTPGEGEAGTIPMDRTEGEAGTTPMVGREGEEERTPMAFGQVETTETRPHTSGKSLKALEMAGLMTSEVSEGDGSKRKRVLLTLNERETVTDGEDYDDLEIDMRAKKTKKRRIVSAAVVSSDEESQVRKPKKVVKGTVDPTWQTYESETPCGHCKNADVVCESFVLRSRGHPRYACCRCHSMKKMCDFTKPRQLARAMEKTKTQRAKTAGAEQKASGRKQERSRSQPAIRKSRGKADDETDGETDEDEDEGHPRRPASKGKGKEKRRSVSKKPAVKMKREEDEDASWMLVDENQPGPSSGLIRRPRSTWAELEASAMALGSQPGEIADLQSRMRAVESSTNGFLDATAVTLQEIHGKVDRVVSDQEVQKKYVLKELVRVEGIAQSALDVSSGVQQQVDSVRQQTRDMHESLTAMHRHSDELTSGLKSMMAGFQNLQFEMPNRFDDWLRVRLGHEGGLPTTIPGDVLRIPSQPQIPATPPLILSNHPTPPGTQDIPTNVEGEAASTQPPSPTTSRPSSTELYRQYVNQHSSQEDLVVNMGETSQNAGTDVVEGEQVGSEEMAKGWQASGDETRTDEEPMDLDVAPRAADEQENVPSDHVPSESSIPPNGNVDPEMEEGELTEAIRSSSNVLPVPHDTTVSVVLSPVTPREIRSSRHSNMSAPSEAGPPSPTAADQERPPSPISPFIIRSHSVEPPLGMLAPEFRLSPASSQPIISSPSPIPIPTLLNVARHPISQSGPMTRARSRSRSPNPVPVEGSSLVQRTAGRKPPSSKSKARSTQG